MTQILSKPLKPFICKELKTLWPSFGKELKKGLIFNIFKIISRVYIVFGRKTQKNIFYTNLAKCGLNATAK